MSTLEDTWPVNILSRNRPAAAMWSAGGAKYDRISRQIADAIEHCVDRLDPRPSQHVLDVATGTGWTARRVNARGANVTGVDMASDVIDAAIGLDHHGEIDFMVADAEALPFSDAEFDSVISTFGVMFCGTSEQAAGELARVCKPGGRLALAIWDDHGGVMDLFKVISRHKPAPKPGTSSPFDWANPEKLEQWLGQNFDIKIEHAISYHREQTSEDAWEAFATGYGPVKSLISTMNADRLADFKEDFLEYHENYRTDAGILVPRPYLIVSGTRRG